MSMVYQLGKFTKLLLRNGKYILALVVFLSTQVALETHVKADDFTTYNSTLSCGGLLDLKENNWPNAVVRSNYQGWLFGWISAVNEVERQLWKNPPSVQGVWQSVLNYCSGNPLDSFHEAVVDVYNQILNKQR